MSLFELRIRSENLTQSIEVELAKHLLPIAKGLTEKAKCSDIQFYPIKNKGNVFFNEF